MDNFCSLKNEFEWQSLWYNHHITFQIGLLGRISIGTSNIPWHNSWKAQILGAVLNSMLTNCFLTAKCESYFSMSMLQNLHLQLLFLYYLINSLYIARMVALVLGMNSKYNLLILYKKNIWNGPYLPWRTAAKMPEYPAAWYVLR